MAHINKVVKSVNAEENTICVEIFTRPDGAFGFEEYRRDVEDNNGWFPIGRYSAPEFAHGKYAWNAIKRSIGVLSKT